MKICNKCNISKSAPEFKKDPRNKDGLQGICRLCNRESEKLRIARLAKGIGKIEITEKHCNCCGLTLPAEDFYKDTTSSDGRYSVCKECKDFSVQQWRSDNREEYNRGRREYNMQPENYKRLRLQRYGITPADFDKMLAEQQGKCKLCFKIPDTDKRPLCVDHNHVTGKVRGLLCYGCNRLMVLIDNEELLKRALAYTK
jgi:hypothetical protein